MSDGGTETRGRRGVAYLAAPFSSKTTSVEGRLYGEFNDSAFASLLQKLEDVLRGSGFDVCLPHRDRGQWGRHYIPPPEIAPMCFGLVSACDLVVALPKQSRGVHMELGWALAKGKKILLFVERGEDVSIFIPGLPDAGDVLIREYSGEDDLVEQLTRALARFDAARRGHSRQTNMAEVRTSAVIEIGSSTLKLYVAEIRDGSISYIDREQSSDITVSDDVNASGSITTETISKLIDLLARWRCKILCRGDIPVRIIAGGAVRKAANRDGFVAALRRALGWDVHIMNQSEEGRAVFWGTIYDFPRDLTYCVLNVGGATTNIIVGTHDRIFTEWCSEDLGIRSLNGILQSDPPSDDEHERVLARVSSVMSSLPDQLSGSWRPGVLIHTGGELDYLVAAKCPMVSSSLSPTHPSEVDVEAFTRFADRIRRTRRESLRRLAPDLTNPKWMDGAVASNAIALGLARKLGAARIVPSNRNVVDGLILTDLEGANE